MNKNLRTFPTVDTDVEVVAVPCSHCGGTGFIGDHTNIEDIRVWDDKAWICHHCHPLEFAQDVKCGHPSCDNCPDFNCSKNLEVL